MRCGAVDVGIWCVCVHFVSYFSRVLITKNTNSQYGNSCSYEWHVMLHSILTEFVLIFCLYFFVFTLLLAAFGIEQYEMSECQIDALQLKQDRNNNATITKIKPHLIFRGRNKFVVLIQDKRTEEKAKKADRREEREGIWSQKTHGEAMEIVVDSTHNTNNLIKN